MTLAVAQEGNGPEQGDSLPRPKSAAPSRAKLLKIDSLPFHWWPRVLCVVRFVAGALLHVMMQASDPVRISVNAITMPNRQPCPRNHRGRECTPHFHPPIASIRWRQATSTVTVTPENRN